MRQAPVKHSCSAIFGNKGSTIFFDSKDAVLLLGFLAATFSRYQLKNYLSHTVETGEEVLLNLPLAEISSQSKTLLMNLVSQIIEKQRVDPYYPYHLHEQKEIDQFIYELYNLTPEEIREVTNELC